MLISIRGRRSSACIPSGRSCFRRTGGLTTIAGRGATSRRSLESALRGHYVFCRTSAWWLVVAAESAATCSQAGRDIWTSRAAAAWTWSSSSARRWPSMANVDRPCTADRARNSAPSRLAAGKAIARTSRSKASLRSWNGFAPYAPPVPRRPGRGGHQVRRKPYGTAPARSERNARTRRRPP